MLAFVLISHTLAVESLPAVNKTSMLGCNANEYTADKCP